MGPAATILIHRDLQIKTVGQELKNAQGARPRAEKCSWRAANRAP
jgi:hypothetical protein